VIQKVGEGSLFVMTAGAPVISPLELLHLDETRQLLEILSSRFRTVILDSPPLASASDANLLATLADGTLLVTRLGVTRVDEMSLAIQSLGQSNVLGIIANGGLRT
jgi:receptor protein-tyrosine kinase